MKTEEGYATNLTKFYIISLLHEKPRHGYEIMEELGRRVGKKPSAGQIYPLLRKMQRRGYVRVMIKYVGGKRRKIYALTSSGKNLSSEIFNRFSDLIDVAVGRKVKACSHCGCQIYKGGYKEKIKGKYVLFCCRHCARSYRK